MPMTRRQLHQTEIDYQDFLPRHGHIFRVREGGGVNAPCAICGTEGVGNTKKVIGYVAPTAGNGMTGDWVQHFRIVCRIGRSCRRRAYEARGAHAAQRPSRRRST